MDLTSVSSRRRAPSLERGSLLFPHLGDWTQRGQPVRHGQDSSVSRVALTHSSPAPKPRSEQPDPPEMAS